MNKITQPTKYYPKIAIYSRPKLGKTLFTTTAGQGKILIVDAQHGTDWMTHPKLQPHVWHIEKWDEWDEVYQFLRNERHGYKVVSAADTINKMHNYALRKVVGAEGEKSLPSRISLPNRGAANEMVKSMLDKFRRLPLCVVYTANERVISKEGEDQDKNALLDSEEIDETPLDVETTDNKYVPDLPNDLRKYFIAEVDVIGRLTAAPDTKDKRGERRLWLAPHDDYDTGYRSLYQLPQYILNPTLPKLLAHMTRKDIDNG